MIRPAAAACSRGAGVTAEVTRQAAAKERSPDDAIPAGHQASRPMIDLSVNRSDSW
jgi:hypothetical protein